MQISAIVLDLDGTLLNSEKKVGSRNYEAIKNCQRAGVPIMIATARPPRALLGVLSEELRSSVIMMYYNGALYYTHNTSEHWPIESALSAQIIDAVLHLDSQAWVSIEVEDTWYSHMDIDYSQDILARQKPNRIMLEQLRKLASTKIILSHFSKIDELMMRFSNLVNILITDSGTIIQISSKEASKEQAVSRMCQSLGIQLADVMVFGDDYNDLGLFQLCGYPVAMGNAIEPLKKIAYEITSTNDEDGVATVLEKYIHAMA